MNVAVFASSFYPHVGGVEEAVRQLAIAYRRQGVSMAVLTNRWPRSLPEFETVDGVPVYRLPFRVPEGSIKARVSYALTNRSIRGTLLEILRDNSTDLLHVQCVSDNAYYALYARERLGLPLVVTCQGERTIDATERFRHSTFVNEVLRCCLDVADRVTACSGDVLSDIERYYGKPLGPRASVVYNGIEPADFETAAPFEHPRPYVLAIGRHVRFKGFHVLLRAWSACDDRSHDLLIAGDGPEHEPLEALARELALGDRVRFLGRADRRLATSLFRGCSFFALPSLGEPQGIVALEAMACAKAVVATRGGGVPEVVRDGETGLLVPMDDVASLASAIGQLARDQELRQRLGSAGQRRAARFNWSQIAQEYSSLYQDALAARRLPQPTRAFSNLLGQCAAPSTEVTS